jgi:hypothetical protein
VIVRAEISPPAERFTGLARIQRLTPQMTLRLGAAANRRLYTPPARGHGAAPRGSQPFPLCRAGAGHMVRSGLRGWGEASRRTAPPVRPRGGAYAIHHPDSDVDHDE